MVVNQRKRDSATVTNSAKERANAMSAGSSLVSTGITITAGPTTGAARAAAAARRRQGGCRVGIGHQQIKATFLAHPAEPAIEGGVDAIELDQELVAAIRQGGADPWWWLYRDRDRALAERDVFVVEHERIDAECREIAFQIVQGIAQPCQGNGSLDPGSRAARRRVGAAPRDFPTVPA